MGKMADLSILLVEDRDNVRNSLSMLLKKSGFQVEAVENGRKALDSLQRNYFDLVLTDYKMSPIDGMTLLRQIKETWPATEVIMMTAFGTIQKGVEAIKSGACEYITKPFPVEELLQLLGKFAQTRSNRRARVALKHEIRKYPEFDAIVGESEELLNILAKVKRVAATHSTVLLLGESGTGKELLAQAIHALSSRKHGPFVAIHSGAIPENLQESELFGHAKGAYTGAESAKKGLFEEGDGGTVFLDEIGDTSLSTQVKLLRFLQYNELRRVGENANRKVDVRLISATNKNLEQEIDKGKFREDLYYRLNVIPITVPPLRHRKGDIPILIDHFLETFSNHAGARLRISKKALAMLLNYDWPGNIRELANVIESTVALANSDEIVPELLPKKIQKTHVSLYLPTSERKLADLENEVILDTLNRMNGNKKKTAEKLGISKSTLWRKLKYMSVPN
ncbi:MAG: sigma-54-dependent transcriptional regulator [bacterium]